MKLLVRADRPLTTSRCREIRERLADFSASRLGATARGEVQGHLQSCQACSEVFGEMLLEDIETGALPLLTPPRMPPVALYARYRQAGNSRFGTLWATVREALQSADVEAREWAQRRIQEIRLGFDLMASPTLFPAAVRTRGAVRVRGAGPAIPVVPAEVLTPTEESSGEVVEFRVSSAPTISGAGHFMLGLQTDASTYDGRKVMCTVTLPGTQALSFDGTLTRLTDDAPSEVWMDEANVPGRPREIPLRDVTLAIRAR